MPGKDWEQFQAWIEWEAKFGRSMGLSQGLLFVHQLGMQAIRQ
jgi:hypothetical protein